MKMQQCQQSVTSFFYVLRIASLFSLTLSECFKFELRNKCTTIKVFKIYFIHIPEFPSMGVEIQCVPPPPLALAPNFPHFFPLWIGG